MAVERPEEWTVREVVSARKLNQQVAAIRRLMSVMGWDENRFADDPKTGVPRGAMLGKIVDAGPGGASDYTDERYWVRELAIVGGAATDPVETQEAPDVEFADPRLPAFGGTGDPLTVEPIRTVTNTIEKDAGDQHVLEVGTEVVYFAILDTSDPVPTIRYVMSVGTTTAPGTETGTGVTHVFLSCTNPTDVGSKTTTAGFTYDVIAVQRNATTGVLTAGSTLATALSPRAPRWNGKRSPATEGLARKIADQWYLLEAWETLGTNPTCATPP